MAIFQNDSFILRGLRNNTLEHFADFVSCLEMLQVANESLYADTAQACLTGLCEHLEEYLDIQECLSIIHNVYMYVATHDEKYREEIGDIIKGIARKENEACSEEKD